MAATKETLAKLEKQISGGTTKAPTVTLAKKTTGSGTSGSKTVQTTTGKTTKSSANTVAEIEKQIINGTTTAPTVKTSTKKASSVPEKAMDTTSTAYYQNQIDSADRLYNILTSTVKDIGAAATQIGGAVVEGAGRLNKSLEDSRNANIAEYEADQTAKAKAQLASGKNEKGEALTSEETYRLNKIVARNAKMPSVRETTSKNILSNTLDTAGKAYSAADTLQAQSSQDMAEAKEGLGKVGSFAVDVGKAAASMAGDAALSAVAPGAGLAAMGIRSGASSAQTARQAGATYGQQLAYGLGSGALSVATEKISNVAGPFKKIFGEGVLDKAISKAASKLTSSAAGRAALSFLSEGGEEVVEDLVQPILQQLTYKKGAMKEMLSTDFVAETLYDGLVGGTLGLLGSGAENIQRRGGTDTEQSQAAPVQTQATPVQSQAQTQTQAETAQNRAETAPESQAAIEWGTDTPATQNAAETILERNTGNVVNTETVQAEEVARPETQENGNPADMFSLMEQEARPQVQTDVTEANRQAAAASAEQTAPAVEETARAAQETQSPTDPSPTVKASEDPASVEKMLKILRKGKRVDGDSLSNSEFDAAADAGAYMDADGKVYLADPESHIDNRSAADMGDRKVHAFQFDHPELHEYFLSAAQDLADDMDMSISYGVMHTTDKSTGVKRHTNKIVETPSIRKAMRTTGVTRDGIIEACKRIIADQGQDNVAAAKRVEIVLRDMLTYGYTRLDGTFVPPNEAYIQETRSIPGAKEAADNSTNDLLEMEDRREQWAAEEDQKTREWWDKVEQQSRERQAQKASEREASAQDGLGNADAGTVNTPFDTMQAESSDFHPINPNSAQSEVEQGIAPVEVPTVNPSTERNIEKTVSTILNAPMTSAEMKSVYENAIAEGSFDYDVATDADAVQASQERLNQEGWKDVATEFTGRVLLGQVVTKQDVSDAVAAYNAAVAAKDYETAFDVAAALTESVHTSAQAVQAVNLFNRLTPEGKLLTLRKIVDKMNREQTRKPTVRKRSKGTDKESARADFIDNTFIIDPDLSTNYFMAETDAERDAAWDAILTNIASQMPSTFKEKADFWRYASMLTNPTTHIRNLSGNMIQAGARKIKNGIGTMLERVAIRDKSGRTKSILTAKDKGLKDFAKSQYAADQEAAMGGGKYTEGTTAGIMREIESRRKVFNGDDVLSKTVQGLGDFNTKLLDGEDVLFNKAAYVESFAQALKAKGVTEAAARSGSRKADVEAARAYAIEEAAKATYRNTTQFSEAVAQMGRYHGDNTVKKIGSLALDALLPFRKTPANILTTGIDYSPIGIAKAVVQMKSGTHSAADVIDSLSAGLTGTGILALGAYLASEGLLKVKAGDDDREEEFEKATGGQDFSVQVGNKTYTLDWAVPAAMPLFAGAAIMESVEDGSGTFSAVLNAMAGTSQVVMETSMLSSLDDLLSGWSYADDKMWYLASEAATTYANQYLPNLGGKLASALDDTVRKSYVGKGTGELISDAEYFAQGVEKKIPGLRNTLQPSVDLWGNEVSNGSIGERLFQNFISPGTLKTIDDSAATQEVKRIAEATGSHSVYPSAADKSFKLNGEDRNLTAEEYTQYAKTLGKTRKALIESVVNNATYKGMSDEEKATVVESIYKYANYTARMELEPAYANEVDAWVLHAKNAQSELGISTADYLALYQEYGSSMLSGSGFTKTQQAVNAGLTVQEYAAMKEGLDANGNGSVSQKEAQQYLNGTKYSRSQKADLWSLINKGWKTNPYE